MKEREARAFPAFLGFVFENVVAGVASFVRYHREEGWTSQLGKYPLQEIENGLSSDGIGMVLLESLNTLYNANV